MGGQACGVRVHGRRKSEDKIGRSWENEADDRKSGSAPRASRPIAAPTSVRRIRANVPRERPSGGSKGVWGPRVGGTGEQPVAGSGAGRRRGAGPRRAEGRGTAGRYPAMNRELQYRAKALSQVVGFFGDREG